MAKAQKLTLFLFEIKYFRIDIKTTRFQLEKLNRLFFLAP